MESTKSSDWLRPTMLRYYGNQPSGGAAGHYLGSYAHLRLECPGSGKLEVVKTSTMKGYGVYTLCTRDGGRALVTKSTTWQIPVQTLSDMSFSNFCNDRHMITVSFDPCMLQSILPPISSQMIQPGEMWVGPHKAADKTGTPLYVVCDTTVVPVQPQPTTTVDCIAAGQSALMTYVPTPTGTPCRKFSLLRNWYIY